MDITADYLDIIDKIDRVTLLLECIILITKDRDFLMYSNKPHEGLLMTIEEKLEEIKKDLYMLGEGDDK